MRLAGKRVSFSIVVTYESNEDYETIFDGRNNEKIWGDILEVPDEVIRQQSDELLSSVPTRFARLFATRKVKLFAQTVPRQPQKILYDERKKGTREFPQPHWRVLPKWLKDRAGLGQKS